MQFFMWGINKPGVQDKRAAMVQDHWSFFDRYEDKLIARGPVLGPEENREVLGSIHILELEDADAARVCASEEPFAKAGLFETIIIKRFTLGLERTQFEFERTPGHPQFFIHCPAKPGRLEDREKVRRAHSAYCRSHDEKMICRGALRTDDGAWDGSVFFLEVPSKADAEAFLENEPYNKAGLFDSPKIHHWTMGGRRKLNADGVPDNS